eukprot:7485032-Karenia_brevis.AAC.1
MLSLPRSGHGQDGSLDALLDDTGVLQIRPGEGLGQRLVELAVHIGDALARYDLSRSESHEISRL